MCNNIRTELLFEDDNIRITLIRIRVKFELLLNKIYPKEKGKSITYLFDLFLLDNPQHKYLRSTFLNVMRLCNTAIHGRDITDSNVDVIVDMGVMIVSILQDYENQF